MEDFLCIYNISCDTMYITYILYSKNIKPLYIEYKDNIILLTLKQNTI